MSIAENINSIKSGLPSHVNLVAVSKTKPIEDLRVAYDAGQRIFGENKVQEMVDKYGQLPHDIQWHMIGHLQRNKVKYIAEFVTLIHAVDSLKLLQEIEKQGHKFQRKINCLLQLKIAEEDSKYGMSFETANEILNSEAYNNMSYANIVGLMGMATFTEDEQVIHDEFKYLKTCYDKLGAQDHKLEILSMGMSGDYSIAISNGSNMIRIGSHIFGSRNYN